MKKITILFYLISLFSMKAQTGQLIPEMTALDNSVQQFMAQWNIPGASIAVAKDGRLVYARGFGFADTSTNELVQPNSRFRMASLSKTITSTTIYTLIEDGLLSLDDTVFGNSGILNDAQYLPLLDQRWANITVKQLLGHQAGTNRFGDNIDPMFSPLTIANALSIPPPAMQNDIISYMTTTQFLEYTPGTNQIYSNFGYTILGRIIEKVSGMDYETYVKTNIMNPLGAPSFNVAKNLLVDQQANEVHYYDNTSSPLFISAYGTGELVPEPYGGVNVEAMDAHGGWISTAADMLKFALAIDGFPTRPDIINNTSLQTMRSFPAGFSSFGHGILLYGGGAFHFGILPGTSAELDLNNPNQIAFVVLFNSQSYNNNYTNSIDAAIWSGLGSVTSWPTHDLFDTLSIDEETFSTVNIYPNPVENEVNFEFNQSNISDVTIEIYNYIGQSIHTINANPNQIGLIIKWRIPENISNGIYFAQISTDTGNSITKKLIFK